MLKRLFILGGLLAAAGTVAAADINKANNADNLNLTTSWTGGVVPTNTDVAVWDSTVTGGLTNLLGANLAFKGVRVTNPGGPIQINAGSTLTVGVSGIDLSAATQDLILSNAVAVAGGTGVSAYQKWPIAVGRTLRLANTLTKNGVGNPVNGTGNGLLEISTTGTLSTTNISRIIFADSQNNPFVLYGPSDWAATDSSGNVVAASYTAAAGTMTANVVNDIQGDTSVATVDVTALRFNDPVPRTVTVTGNNTHTARGILVTANCGGGTITGGNIRPSRGSSGGSAPTAFPIIQNSASDFTIASTFAVASSSTPVHLIKYGKGNLILTSAFVGGINGQGGCTVMEGTLTLNGAPMGTGTNVVNQGKLVVRSGTTPGAPANFINNGGTNAINVVAANGQATMTNVTFGSGTTSLEFSYANGIPLSTTAAPFVVAGTLTANATINLAVISGGITVGQFPLVKYTTLAGAGFAAFNSSILLPPHVTASLSNNTANSTIDLVVTAVTTPLKWSTGSGTWDINTTANWKDNTGASSTYQQIGSLGDSVLFEDSLSGASPITVTLNSTVLPTGTIISNNTKAYTISGSGSIAGNGGLIKAGSSTLVLSTANTFKGGLSVNGGVLTFTSNGNLSSGAISFGGGTLQYAPGNTSDISLRTVTLAAGGGSIDLGANNVTFAAAVGNNGAGGLTKLGSGTLTLNGVNLFSGNTVISSGTLALGAAPASVTNSAAIVISSGTTLDLATSGNSPMILNSAVGQILAGSGTIQGGITAPAGTTITPGTNGTVATLTINGGDLTLGGATFACDVTSSTRDLIVVNGGLTISGGTLQLNVTGTLANGRYKLIQYSTGLLYSGLGSSAKMTVTGFSQPGKAAALSDSVDGEIDLVISDTATDVLTWAGVGPEWNLAGTLNWLNGATAWAFTNGDSVTFDAVGALQPSVSVLAPVSPTTLTVTIPDLGSYYSLDDGTGTGGGKVTGGTSVIKNGPGTLIVNTINDNTGPTTVNGGTLQVNGSIGTGVITNNAELLFTQSDNRNVNGISGTGNLTQGGSAVLTLVSNNNNFSGGITIGSGTLQVGNGGAAGSYGTTASVTNNGTLTFNKTGTYSVTNSIEGSGAVSLIATSTVTMTASNSYTGGVSVSGGAKLIAGSANALAGGGALTLRNDSVVDMSGHDLTIARLFSSVGLGGRLVNNAGAATNVLTINYDGTGTADSSIAIADNDGTGGKVQLVKVGTGTQMLRGASTYSGGTIITAGALQARQANTAFGTATNVILNGGTLDSFSSFLAYTIETRADSGIFSAGNCGFDGPFIGTNNVLVTMGGTVTSGETISWETANQLTNFSGRFTVTADSVTLLSRNWRWNPAANTMNGSAKATWDLQANVAMGVLNPGCTIYMGALSGSIGTALQGNTAAGTTWIVGALNTNTTFSGQFMGAGSFVKEGTAPMTLDGMFITYWTNAADLSVVSNYYTGSIVVSNGVLALAAAAQPTNSPTIRPVAGAVLDVQNLGYSVIQTDEFGAVTNIYVVTNSTLSLGATVAQTLTGSGTVQGKVAAGVNSTINPGDGIGTLTVSSSVNLGGLVLMELNRTNAPATNDMLAASSFTVGGTLTVTNLGPALYTGSVFKLFNHPVSGFAAVNLPVSDGAVTYSWNNKLSVDGTIVLLAGLNPVNTNPTNITVTAVSPTQYNLSWPADHTGWSLLTNSVDVANTNFWFLYPGSASVNNVTITVNPSKTNVFFKMVYPYP